MYRFPWYLTLVSTNHASSNPGQSVNRAAYSKAREWINTEIMRNGFEILVWAIFPQMYLWIHDKYSSIRFKTVWMAEKDTSKLLIFTESGCSDRMAQWLKAALYSLEEVLDARSNPRLATSFFFLLSFFYPLAFYFLFSLLTLLASRDFCENVFLVIDCCHWNWLSVYRLTTPGTSRNVSYRFEGSMTFTQMSSFPSLERFAEAGSSILRRRVQTLLGLQCTLTKPLTVSAWKTPALGFAK